MARKIRKGATDISVILRAIDSTTGVPKTDFAYNTAGIDLWYRRNGAMVTSITEATLAAADTAHSDGGVIHLGNGYFRLDSPDAAFATGVNSVMFGGTATGVIIIGTEIQLVNYDPEDAVRLGLTALPNAAADAAGGLPISDAGALDLDTQLATLTNGTYGLSAIETLVDEIESRLTAVRAGYLDNLSDGAVALASVCTDARLAELGAANIPADIDTLISRLTALRAGYLDNLSTAPPSAPTIRAEIDSNSTQLATIVADTAEIQTELADGGRTDLILDAILGDTNELQTDWHDGGRLDLLLDVAIAAVAGLTGSYARVITVQNGSSVAVIAANVEVWDAANTVFYQRLQTNSSGQVTFNMDAGTYTIRIFKEGYSFADATLVISGAGSTTYNMTPFTTPTASNVNMCRVYGYFMTPEGGFYATLTPSAVVEETYDSGNNFFKGDVTGGYVAATGLVYWDIVQGATARVRIQEIGYEAEITVPELSSSKLEDLV